MCGRGTQLVELKSGETYNGNLEKCDNWMNLNLREVICTSRVRLKRGKSRVILCVKMPDALPARVLAWAQDGDQFFRLPEVYIRGNTIKYLRVPDEVVEKVDESDVEAARKQQSSGGRGRGRGAGRGGGRGRGRGDRGRGGRGDRGRGRGRGRA